MEHLLGDIFWLNKSLEDLLQISERYFFGLHFLQRKMSEESQYIIDESIVDLTSANDMDVSRSGSSVDIKPEIKPEFLSMLYRPPVPPSMVVEQKKKPEQRPVKHRNTGKISIGNLARRRLLSVSADSADDFRRLRLNEQQNRTPPPPPIRRAPQVPLQRPAPAATTTTIFVRSTVPSSMAPGAVTGQGDPDGVASMVANSTRAEPSVQSNQQQQPPQSQQLEALVRQINTETFCIICQTQYANRHCLTKHRKSQKHQNNTRNMSLARQELLEQAFAQVRANRANP